MEGSRAPHGQKMILIFLPHPLQTTKSCFCAQAQGFRHCKGNGNPGIRYSCFSHPSQQVFACVLWQKAVATAKERASQQRLQSIPWPNLHSLASSLGLQKSLDSCAQANGCRHCKGDGEPAEAAQHPVACGAHVPQQRGVPDARVARR